MAKTFETMEFTKQQEIAQLFATWLACYTETVIDSVLARKDEIINNEFSMMLLTELSKRQEEESKDFNRDILFVMEHGGTMGYHNHPLEHSKSYRDVLYDMYIRDTPSKEEGKTNDSTRG